jgi:hypothetical protein
MDLSKELNVAVGNYIKSDKFKEDINKKAEEMVTKILDDTFGYFGGIRKQMEELIKEQISINTAELDFSGHNKFITEVVGKHLKKCLREDTEKQITEQLSKIVSPTEKVISMETLQDKLLEHAELSEFMNGCYDVDLDYLKEHYSIDEMVTIIVEPTENRSWVSIYLDKEPDKSKYSCEFSLTVHETFTTFRRRDVKIRATDKILDYQFDFEDYIYQLFLNGSTIDYKEAMEWSKNVRDIG